jgi:vacuolar-type H+-ATPase catalytic subunit A/Vma1
MRTNEHAEFLRRQAAALRDLALRSPRIAEALRRLADRLDEMADEVEGKPATPED